MSNDVEFVDCQGLGGGMTLGFVQAGGKLVHKAEQTGAFGTAQMDGNRHLLGKDWSYEDGPQETWEAFDVPIVMGNPPCSGFSLLNSTETRGMENAINSCMWDIVDYAARCKADVVVMESVQQAGRAGRPLMQSLRTLMEGATNRDYTLYHCYHNSINLGGASVRRRYFMVMSAIPFGVEERCVARVPIIAESIGDLAHFGDHRPDDMLQYTESANWWTRARRQPQACDGHVTNHDLYSNAHAKRLQGVLDIGDWQENEPMEFSLKRYYERTGEFPEGWTDAAVRSVLHRPLEKCADYDQVKVGAMTEDQYMLKWATRRFPAQRPEPWPSNAYSPRRWRASHAGRVISGDGPNSIIHPWLNRTLTFREVARLMGFPDNWNVEPYYNNKHGYLVFGKGVVVEAGRWIGEAAVNAVNGEPYDHTGELIGENEYEINLTNTHRDIYNERTGERKTR